MNEPEPGWVYPASAWDPDDRVEIDSEGHPWHGELGRVIGLDDRDEGTWDVRLDSGEEVTAYGYELNGVITGGGA